jgi:hypothetical protein
VVTQVTHYLNGGHVSGRNERTSSVFNPATGEQTGLVPIANAGVDLRRPLHARPGRRLLRYPVENDHEPLANRDSNWRRIRNAYHVLIANDWPAAHPGSGHGSQKTAINPSASVSRWPSGHNKRHPLGHTENDDATFVLRSNSRAFRKADQYDIGCHA